MTIDKLAYLLCKKWRRAVQKTEKHHTMYLQTLKLTSEMSVIQRAHERYIKSEQEEIIIGNLISEIVPKEMIDDAVNELHIREEFDSDVEVA